MQRTKAITAYIFRISPMIILLLFVLMISGCSTKHLNPYKDMSTMEIAWQVGHAIDAAQTYSMAGDPCYKEVDYLTRRVIGTHPSKGKVVAWSIGTSYVHAAVDKWIEYSKLPKAIKTVARAFALGSKLNTITHNYEVGIRIFSDNRPTRCTRI